MRLEQMCWHYARSCSTRKIRHRTHRIIEEALLTTITRLSSVLPVLRTYRLALAERCQLAEGLSVAGWPAKRGVECSKRAGGIKCDLYRLCAINF